MVSIEMLMDTQRARRQAQLLRRDLDRLGDEAVDAQRKLRSLQRAGFRGRGGAGGVFGIGRGGLGAALGIGGGFAGVTLFRRMIGGAAEFDEALRSTQALLGETEERMQSVTRTSFEMARGWRFSARDVVKAIDQAVRAGKRLEQAEGLVGTARGLATISGQPLDRVVAQLGVVQTQFPLRELADIADILARARAAVRVDLDQLVPGLRQGAVPLKNLGFSLERLVAASAELTNQGMQSAQSVRLLRTAMITLSDPSAEAEAELRKIDGVLEALFQKDAPRALRLIAQSADQIDLGKIVRPESATALQGYFQGLENIDRITKELENSTGALDRQMEIFTQSTTERVREAASAWSDLGTRIGQAMEPAVRNLSADATELANELESRGLPRIAGELGQTVQGMVRGLGEGIEDLQSLITTGGFRQRGPTRGGFDVDDWVRRQREQIRQVSRAAAARGVTGAPDTDRVPLNRIRDQIDELYDTQIRKLEDQAKGLSDAAVEARQFVRELGALTLAEEKEIGVLERTLSRRNRLTNQLEKERRVRDALVELEFDRVRLFRSGTQRRTADLAIATGFGPDLTFQDLGRLEAQVERLDFEERLDRLGRGSADALTQVAGAFAIMGDEGVDAIERIARALQALALEELALAPLRNLLESIAGDALAGIFQNSGGSPRAHTPGGVGGTRTVTPGTGHTPGVSP